MYQNVSVYLDYLKLSPSLYNVPLYTPVLPARSKVWVITQNQFTLYGRASKAAV